MAKHGILIVGVTSGIGRALACHLISRGKFIIGVGRSLEKIEILKRELLLLNGEFLLKDIDFSNENEVSSLTIELRNEEIKLTGIVHTAGITSTLPLKLINEGKFKDVMMNNVFTFFQVVSKFTHRDFISKVEGMSILTLSSIMGNVGESGKSLYAASKGALQSAVKSMAVELAPKGIRVNSISPGVVLTPMVGNGYYAQNKDLYEKIEKNHLLGYGNEDDIVPLIEFLLSKESKWITGADYVIDGGYTAK
jgi:NAD(P)-dependent dehydrogenase (short-subunit alcohol dehydrogenase family)